MLTRLRGDGARSPFEIRAEDPERGAEFYRGVFGWEIEKWDGPVDYWLVTRSDDEDGINGAVIRRMGGAPATPRP